MARRQIVGYTHTVCYINLSLKNEKVESTVNLYTLEAKPLNPTAMTRDIQAGGIRRTARSQITIKLFTSEKSPNVAWKPTETAREGKVGSPSAAVHAARREAARHFSHVSNFSGFH